MHAIKPIPEGITVLTPMLVCRDPAAEMDFCRTVFGAVERNRRLGPDGRVAHGLMNIGDCALMIESEWPTLASRAPSPDASSPVVLYVYVPDVDAAVERAAQAGAIVLLPPEDRFWGDRTARIVDPAGHVWTIATRVEEPEENERRRRWDQLRSE